MTAAMACMVVTMAALVDSSDNGVPAVSRTMVKRSGSFGHGLCAIAWQVHDICSEKQAYGVGF